MKRRPGHEASRIGSEQRDEFSFAANSYSRRWIEQPVRWWAGRGFVVRGYRCARRDRKHSCLSTNLSRTMGTDILELVPGRYCRFLLKLRCLFRGLNSCLAD